MVRWFYKVVLGNKTKGDISRNAVKKGDSRKIKCFTVSWGQQSGNGESNRFPH